MPARRSTAQWAAQLAAGVVDAADAIDQTLAAVDACDDRAIFTLTTPERARTAARASLSRQRGRCPLGWLDGVPVAWKDLFDLSGHPTTAGSRVLADAPPATADAAIVTRLEAAGMVSVGRVNMTEFAFSGLGLNPHYGTPVNPHGQRRVPGGSSSGSGVAVARGLVPVSIGTDTSGSVRIPAAFNGVVGFKTSGGRWPMHGAYPLSHTLDTLGILCLAVLDAILVDAAARRLAAPDLRRGRIRDLRLIAPTNVVLDDCEPAVTANFEAALGRLENAGARIERRIIPALDEVLALNARYGPIVNAEAYALHKERVDGEAAAQMDRRVASRIRLAAATSLTAYIAIMEARRRLVAETAAMLEGGWLVAYPTVAHVAPSIDALEADDDLFVRINMKTLRNTLLGNFLDWCGVSIPNGFDAEGMPTGFLLSGGPGRDDHLLAMALAAESIIRDDVGQSPHDRS
ncbi:amidase [Microvirga makkahensis]|uniref:Amidase n=1 Tax=Microvirga makkahensis TaxID=1128670 RepID=A0A7X3MPI0_9HYPH|nr:amidase [Microvirga makkahensis]MXQ10792.1 amidase [Microvirga makkahensis]